MIPRRPHEGHEQRLQPKAPDLTLDRPRVFEPLDNALAENQLLDEELRDIKKVKELLPEVQQLLAWYNSEIAPLWNNLKNLETDKFSHPGNPEIFEAMPKLQEARRAINHKLANNPSVRLSRNLQNWPAYMEIEERSLIKLIGEKLSLGPGKDFHLPTELRDRLEHFTTRAENLKLALTSYSNNIQYWRKGRLTKARQDLLNRQLQQRKK